MQSFFHLHIHAIRQSLKFGRWFDCLCIRVPWDATHCGASKQKSERFPCVSSQHFLPLRLCYGRENNLRLCKQKIYN